MNLSLIPRLLDTPHFSGCPCRTCLSTQFARGAPRGVRIDRLEPSKFSPVLSYDSSPTHPPDDDHSLLGAGTFTSFGEQEPGGGLGPGIYAPALGWPVIKAG